MPSRTGGCHQPVTHASQQFTGHVRDTATNLDYFGARYYSGAMGRFLSPDPPFADQHADAPQSWNLYSYVRNKPLVAVDPNGRQLLLVPDPVSVTEAVAAAGDFMQGVGKGWINAHLDGSGRQPTSLGEFFVSVGVRRQEAINPYQQTGMEYSGVAMNLLAMAISKRASGRTLRSSGSATPYYPPNQGFQGKTWRATLSQGSIVDRYGGPGGSYVSPKGTPPAARSLPFGGERRPLNAYEVIKPFEVEAGRTAPWFDQPGGGIQYSLGKRTVQDLVESGHLRPLK
jgi:RHS repeat-associated protein